ncbi:MAG: polyphosphate polymerase domain-containing protein [Ornithinimicrobium sp.]
MTRRPNVWMDTVRDLPAITLQEVEDRAALQVRVDRKYLLDPHTWSIVLASLDERPSVLEIEELRRFRYSSTYYDTSGLDSYRDAARSRPHRYKVRTRRYLDTGSQAVEVKMRSASGATVKSRQWLDASEVGGPLPDAAVTFLGQFDRIGDQAHELTQVLTTTYERVTLVTDQSRVTVDRHVAATDTGGRHMDYGDLLFVETKSDGGAGAVDRALWAAGIRPVRISKYCTSLAALRPELPANRWSRSLRRYLPKVAAHAVAA